MFVILVIAVIVVLCLLIAMWLWRMKDQRELVRHSITPESLHTLLSSNPEILVFDVRQPLDLLADSEIIPGAKRIPPKELLENPSLIPKEKDSVVYCTCATDETARRIVKIARSMRFLNIKFLRGGLEAWKALGYSVVPYEQSFHLDTRT
jgi:rhodanese-related sulfurtransferase